MAPHIFGAGPGHLSRRAIVRADQLGAEVVNHTDAGDRCGYGCRPYTCRAAERHWLTVPDWSGARDQGLAIVAQLTREGLL